MHLMPPCCFHTFPLSKNSRFLILNVFEFNLFFFVLMQTATYDKKTSHTVQAILGCSWADSKLNPTFFKSIYFFFCFSPVEVQMCHKLSTDSVPSTCSCNPDKCWHGTSLQAFVIEVELARVHHSVKYYVGIAFYIYKILSRMSKCPKNSES